MRILIADDNEDSVSTLAFLLETMGHEVHQAGDGEAALGKVADADPDLVLLDIGMPKLSGYDVCRRIRARDGGNKRTIVAVTGWGQAHDKWLAQEAGFDRHLVKPLGVTELEDILHATPSAEAPRRQATA